MQEVTPIQEISPNDTMLVTTQEHYFQVGRSALRCIQAALLINESQKITRILDFPCGHGRVLRFLKAAFPDAQLAAGDIDRDAVDFCAKTFGASPIYSARNPQQIETEGSFDLIWCGSLLTHFDEPMCIQFLNFFKAVLVPRGILVFTMHGRLPVYWLKTGISTYGLEDQKTPRLLESYASTGFGYLDYPGVEGYGISIASSAKTLSQLQEIGNMKLLLYTESGWDNHQDVIACTHLPDSPEFKA